MHAHLYDFGSFRLDPGKRRLLRGDSLISLTPKAFDTLLVLLESRGAVLERSQLIAQIWPDTRAGGNNLNQCIAVLRKALEDDSRQPTYIVTLPGRGYCFIAEVRVVPNSPLEAAPDATPEPATHRSIWGRRLSILGRGRLRYMLAVSLLLILAVLPTRWSKVRSAFIPNRHLSVSVLPFADLDDMPHDRYLGQGLSEELAAELGELPALKVVASGPRFQTGDGDVRALAHELNVGSILKGSVRRSGSQYRIAVQLIDGNDGRELWSNIFSGTVSDLPIMEEQVVRHTAQVLRVPVVPELQQTLARRAGENPETHEAYLQARYYWTKRDQASMRTSLELYQQAIAQDQNYALAYAGLADWYAVNAGTESMPVRVALPRARLFAKKAMDLDPTLAEPHAALGLLKCFAEWDWQGAREEFNRALALNPGYGTAHHWAGLNLIAMGKFEEADAELRKAAELDPLSPMISEGRAENFYYWHRFDDAIQVLQGLRSREQDPKAFLWPLAGALAAAGRYQEAYDNFQKAGPDGSPDVFALAEARLKILIGDRRDARVTLKKIEAKFRPGDPNPSYIASVHLALGEPDQAMIWLRRAYEQRDPMMVGIRWQPEMDSLKSDPRFLQLVHEVETAHDKSGGT